MKPLNLLSKIKSKIQPKQAVPEPEKLDVAGGVPDISDLVAPDGVYVGEDHLRMGERYARVFHVTELPPETYVTWLEDVYRIGDIDITFHLYPGKNHDVINELTHKISQHQSQLMIEEKKGNIHNISVLERRVRDAWRLREAIQTNQDKVFFCSIQIMISADSKEDLDRKSRYLEESLGARSAYSRINIFEQLEGFKSIAPLGQNLMGNTYRTISLGGAVSMFPCNNAELNHPDGTLFGINRFTGAPVFYNLHIGPPVLDNHNMCVFGVSGSGKSSFIKLYTARSSLKNVRTVIVDPEGEYDRLCEILNGVFIQFKNDEPAMINPFDLEEEDGNVYLLDKILEMRSLISSMVEIAGSKLNAEELSKIDNSIKAEYETRGITHEADSLYEKQTGRGMIGRRKKAMPTLSDIHNRLKEEGSSERLVSILEPFLAGGTLGIFDGPSQVNIHNAHLVVFDVSHLEEHFMRPLAMQVVQEWAWEKFMKKDPTIKKQIIFDEAWRSMKYENTADALENFSRRSRKRSGGLITATQSFHEFTLKPQGKAILTNSATTMLMKQKDTDIDSVKQLLGLPQGQVDILLSQGTGDVLLRHGNIATAVHVNPTDFEMHIIETGVSLKDESAST